MPAPGYEFLVADYNQIELRCIAHLAEDPGLIEAFERATTSTPRPRRASSGWSPTTVTTEQRSKAKMVSYGLAYGMEAYGLAQRLNIPTAEAQEILDAYFEAFPAVQAYMERTVAEARERGYTETLFGRRRQIPELQLVQLPHPPGRRAPGHERRHPGPGRRHLQGGAGPPRRRSRRRGARPAASSCRCTTR